MVTNHIAGQARWNTAYVRNGELRKEKEFFFPDLYPQGAPLMAQILKDLPAMQETQVQPLGWEDPLEKRMAWRRLWTEKPWGYSPRCRVGHN